EGPGDRPVSGNGAGARARRSAEGSTESPGMREPSGTSGDPAASPAQTGRLRQAAQVAALWLDPVVTIDVPSTQVGVLSRATWLHRTLPRWKTTVEPVAKYMAGAIGEARSSQVEQMPMEMPGGDPGAMMERIGGTMFGVQ